MNHLEDFFPVKIPDVPTSVSVSVYFELNKIQKSYKNLFHLINNGHNDHSRLIIYHNFLQQKFTFKTFLREEGSRCGRHKPPQTPPVAPAGKSPSPPSAWSLAGGPCGRWRGCPPHCPLRAGRRVRGSPGVSPRCGVPAPSQLSNGRFHWSRY